MRFVYCSLLRLKEELLVVYVGMCFYDFIDSHGDALRTSSSDAWKEFAILINLFIF